MTTDSLPGLAIELIRLNVDVIVTYATGVPAAQRTTSTIPIVMATYSDAVAAGIVASVANPGGNVTGSTFFNPELMAKRLELLKEIAPSMARAGVLLFRRSAMNRPMLEAMERTANVLGAELQPIEIDRPTDLEGAFSVLANQQVGGLVVGDHVFFRINARPINVLAEKHRLPSIGRLELATTGGLMAYGVDFSEQFRRAAVFVDKILKGTKASGHPGRAGNQVHHDCQPQDRQGARDRSAAAAARPRRRGHRMMRRKFIAGLRARRRGR